MGKIEIEGMYFYAMHGHFESERVVGNHFLVDVVIETDCSKAAESDNLDDALNYQAVYEAVKNEMEKPSHLLEHVAGRIIKTLKFRFAPIQQIHVKVSKLNPPMGGQINKVSVSLNSKTDV